MNALFCALDKNEFNRVSTSTSAHQIWHTLEVTHEGTNKVKESKISILMHRFELFKMEEYETITDMITRFTDTTNTLIALGKVYTQVEMVRKVLRALTPEWEKKTTAIEEANNLSTLTLENLVGNLMAYEVQLQDRRENEQPKKKLLAFNASSDTDTSDDSDSDEDVDTLSKKFRKFLTQSKYTKIKNTNIPICYKCDKAGHYKKDCPLLKTKFKKKKKNKALQDDYDSSSSENEEMDKETTNMCFVTQLNEVSNSNEQDELLNVFNELFCEFKKEKMKNKFLRKENDNLIDTNSNLALETSSLNSRFSDLEKDISVLKNKYDDFLKNISEFKNKVYSHNSYVNHNISLAKNYHAKYKNIWVPKYLNHHDKNVYITSYMNDVYSNNYLYTNKWKPNSK